MSRASSPALASAAAVLAGGGLVLSFHELGPQSTHMALHIALMNAVAPLGAVIIIRFRSVFRAPLWAVAVLQIALLWIWHAPPLQRLAIESHFFHAVMHGCLFMTALFFWHSLVTLTTAARWQAIPVLMLTGKLVCLLSALLVFAPRSLYTAPNEILSTSYSTLTALGDQQLAGLLMMAACLLSYVASGVVFAAQAISDLARESHVSRAGKSVAGT